MAHEETIPDVDDLSIEVLHLADIDEDRELTDAELEDQDRTALITDLRGEAIRYAGALKAADLELARVLEEYGNEISRLEEILWASDIAQLLGETRTAMEDRTAGLDQKISSLTRAIQNRHRAINELEGKRPTATLDLVYGHSTSRKISRQHRVTASGSKATAEAVRKWGDGIGMVEQDPKVSVTMIYKAIDAGEIVVMEVDGKLRLVIPGEEDSDPIVLTDSGIEIEDRGERSYDEVKPT